MKLYLASGNAHKVQEFQALADRSGLPLEFVSANVVGGMPKVVEDTGTFIGNARKKAQALKTLLPREALVLADDSGLCVDELAGQPGVESAYYAGPEGDGAANLRKLVSVMEQVPAGRRGAHFYCVLLLLDGEGNEHVFEGRIDGSLSFAPRGGNGFGYDPLFLPRDGNLSLAELSEAEKNQISHRGRAAQKLFAWLMESLGTNA